MTTKDIDAINQGIARIQTAEPDTQVAPLYNAARDGVMVFIPGVRIVDGRLVPAKNGAIGGGG